MSSQYLHTTTSVNPWWFLVQAHLLRAGMCECVRLKQSGDHYGMNAPITPARLDLESEVANSVQSLVRSLSTRPDRHIASVLGRTSFTMNSLMLATTDIGGGGGVGGGVTEMPPPGGGGGAAKPLSQTTPSAILPAHGSMRAYLRQSAQVRQNRHINYVCVKR